MDNAELASDLTKLLKTFNRGVKVEIGPDGIVKVYTKIRKSAIGVATDLRLTRAFSQVSVRVDDCGTRYAVTAIPQHISV